MGDSGVFDENGRFGGLFWELVVGRSCEHHGETLKNHQSTTIDQQGSGRELESQDRRCLDVWCDTNILEAELGPVRVVLQHSSLGEHHLGRAQRKHEGASEGRWEEGEGERRREGRAAPTDPFVARRGRW